MDNSQRIAQLQQKIEILLVRQQHFIEEINLLKNELSDLKKSEEQAFVATEISKPEIVLEEKSIEENFSSETLEEIPQNTSEEIFQEKTIQQEPEPTYFENVAPQKSDLEKFIGENLISKIGIAVTVIGVAIGIKYSIENELISPLTRIVLGYLFGAGLLGFAIKLKAKYENYSAILLSGAMAIMYFITFSAYNFYGLIPQTLAFIVMVVFTAFTVFASLQYNKQVIALYGMVGAYAVPFLLSDGSGRVAILFSYIAIINIGLMVIAFKKYWKLLHYVSFGLTWLIYASWFVSSYDELKHFGLAFAFLFVFFATFYVAFLAYKLLKKEKFEPQDVFIVFTNSFIFYGFGCAILTSTKESSEFLGLFTVANALLHFLVCRVIYAKKLADKNLFNVILGMVLIFLTIAIPVQLDGNWVTLLWAGEALLLFWIGRTKKVAFYEMLSYPVMLIAFFSLIDDWSTYYQYDYVSKSYNLKPIFNIMLLTSVLYLVAFAFINKINLDKKNTSEVSFFNKTPKVFTVFMGALFVIAFYCAFYYEIEYGFDKIYLDSPIRVNFGGGETEVYNNNLDYYKDIWLINYSLLFVSALAFFNLKKLKNEQLGVIAMALLVITILVYLLFGLSTLSDLTNAYLGFGSEYFNVGFEGIAIRYVSYAFVALALVVSYLNVQQNDFIQKYSVPLNIALHIAVLWILSSELIHLMDLAHSTQSDKLGLSILWGIYSFVLIVFGIWKKKKHLRFIAFGLFGITLIKLFIYDLANLNTISKTIVLVILGVLLLIISFLYNKYKHIISDDETKA